MIKRANRQAHFESAIEIARLRESLAFLESRHRDLVAALDSIASHKGILSEVTALNMRSIARKALESP